jgi:branched-chain amino acid transport system ATP-binding protein
MLDGEELIGRDMRTIARAGVSLVPEDRRIFPNLTVAENLKLAQVTARRPGWTLEHVYEKFPRLRERLTHRGDEISGGEKQMLAIARALLQDVRVLLLDEPTEGLAPLVVREVEDVIHEIKDAGITTLLVEQNLYSALAVADRCYIIDQGEIKAEATPDEIRADADLRRRYLHV